MRALLLTFGVVFVAELGDKSQLLALALATRFRPLPTLAGLTVAALVLQGLAVAVGALVGEQLPTRTITLLAGLAFLAFGVWTLLDRDDEDAGKHEAPAVPSRWAVAGIAFAFLVAEMGDKTQLATIALATTQPPIPTWLGATLGMVVGDGLAVLVGGQLGRRLPRRAVRLVAAAAFFAFGALLLAGALAS